MASLSSTPPPPKYEVFLSFRGEDTRNNFVSHLYKALVDKGIVTYMDDQNLEKGDLISLELLKAIEDSKFSIIIFSKDYASSRWCLDELVQIMKCRAECGQTVIPIFYNVDPSDVRNQKNSFAESLATYEVKYKEKVQIWKQNLFEAAGLAGEDIRERNEASCIKKIAEDIFWKLPLKTSPRGGLVGIESRKAKIESVLFRKLDGVCFVGIWGMGGIGKTTIARAVFDNHIHGFEGGCFLPNVRKGEMVELQNILLSKVLKVEAKISDEYEGSRLIEQRLCSKKVLLVLDDVDDIKQLESLAGARDWFGSGSRIIITTRDMHSINELEVDQTYEVEYLSDREAMELFLWHAFKKKNPPTEDFVHLSHRAVSYADGLPLALEVLGSHLRGRRICFWRSALDRLKDSSLDKRILTTLQISFEGLNDNEKDIFLDISCFFRGDWEHEVKAKLSNFGFYPEEGIDVLVEKSLIHILGGRIEMHDLIQGMGQHIVRQKANNEPGQFSRLWLQKDIIDVLTYNKSTAKIEGVVLRGDPNDGQEIKLSKGAFRNMSRLRLLEIEIWRSKFSRAPDYLPHTLRCLHWDYYPAKSLPDDFEPRNLVRLCLRGSNIVRTPDFNCMPNLEVLDLAGCRQLLKVDPSIGVVKKLAKLDLSGCRKLKKLTSSLLGFEYLEMLYLSGCSNLAWFDETFISTTPAFSILPSLRGLDMSYCNISVLPESITRLPSLRVLYLVGNLFSSLPESINRLSCLQVLSLRSCQMLDALPQLPLSIQRLDLDDCISLTAIPNLVDLLRRSEDLHGLWLENCWKLVQCSLSNSALQQRVPHFLSAFWDWGCMSNILCTRPNELGVTLPPTEMPDWFYQITGSQVVVTLSSPSWYNDKLRGFAIFATNLNTDDSPRTSFIYLPMHAVKSGREWKAENDGFVFQVIDRSRRNHFAKWGICLVCNHEVYKDNSDLRITTCDRPNKKDDEYSMLKVCARIHQDTEVSCEAQYGLCFGI